MPYVNKPRPYKKEYKQQKARKHEKKRRAARERIRYELDNPGKDGKVINRKGKDIDHIKPLSKGGTNGDGNIRLVPAGKNRSFHRNSDHTVKKNTPRKKK
jgi:hypothetical protein